MNVNIAYPPRPARRGRVIALHCSGSGASQWSYLSEALGGSYELLAPEHFGCPSAGPWTGQHAFTLTDEAERVLALIDGSDGKVHLVGHSYGGGVALNAALARRDRIASMTLYEPSAFHLLRQMGEAGAEAFTEITSLTRKVCEGVVIGNYRGAAVAFVDYWNGHGAWAAMRPAVQQALLRWMPKAPLDFMALIEEVAPTDAYRALDFPVLMLRGQNALTPSRMIAERLSHLLPACRLMAIDGAGHMGPLTHAPEVSTLMAQHIVTAEAEARHRAWSNSLARMHGTPSRWLEAAT